MSTYFTIGLSRVSGTKRDCTDLLRTNYRYLSIVRNVQNELGGQ